MLAKRPNALRTWTFDLHQLPPVGMMTRDGGHLDALAAQRERHINGLPIDDRDAVAAMTDVIDDQAFNHDARR